MKWINKNKKYSYETNIFLIKHCIKIPWTKSVISCHEIHLLLVVMTDKLKEYISCLPYMIILVNQDCIYPKFSGKQAWAKSVDPDQTALLGAV